MAAVAMTRAALAASCLLLLSACDPHALQRREAALSAYVGGSEADLVRSLGVPTRSFEANGHRFLAYDQGSVEIEPPLLPWRPWGFGYGYGGGFPAQVVAHTCETTFEVAGGRVTGFTLRGDACA